MSYRELLRYYGYSGPGWLGAELANAISAGLRALGSGCPAGADDLALLVGRGDRISQHHSELEAAVSVLTSELDREARAIVQIVADLREMWNSMWTVTQCAGDVELRDRRFEAWLADPAQRQLVVDRIAVGGMWRAGRWTDFDDPVS